MSREVIWLRGLDVSMAQCVGFLCRPHAYHLTKPQHLRQYAGVDVDSPVYHLTHTFAFLRRNDGNHIVI